MPYDLIHQHVENGGGKRVILDDPAIPSEEGTIVLPCSGYHKELVLVEAEESLCPHSDAIFYQDIH